MLLTLGERFAILQTLPAQGNLVTLKVIRKLRESLAPSEEEFKEFQILTAGQEREDGTTVPEDRIVWNDKGREPREIEIGEKAKDVIAEAFKKLERDNQLPITHLELYEKFVGE